MFDNAENVGQTICNLSCEPGLGLLMKINALKKSLPSTALAGTKSRNSSSIALP
jgi:hypothetical protein